MGCQFTEPRKPPGTDISTSAPEVKELLDAFPHHRPLILALFDAIRSFSPEASYDRWFRLIRDEVVRLPPRIVNVPAVEAPGDLASLLETLRTGHICVGRLRKGEMLYLLGVVFRDLALANAFQVSPEDFMEFAKGLVTHMKTLYHSFEYGVMSALTLFTILQNSLLLQRTLSSEEKLSLLLACLGCVYDHPCRTNEFLVHSQHTLATVFLNEAVVENHCAADFITYLQKYAFLGHLTTSVGMSVLRLTKSLIIGLEPSLFKRRLSKFRAGETPGDDSRKRTLLQIVCFAATGWPFLTCVDCKTLLQKQLVQEFAREAKEAELKHVFLDAEEEKRFSLEAFQDDQEEAWKALSTAALDQSPLKEKVEQTVQIR